MKWKGITKIGLMAGTEYGAPFFREWRRAKAQKDFLDEEVDFIIFAGGLINAEHLTARFLAEHSEEKPVKIPYEAKVEFARGVARELAQRVLPLLTSSDSILKYWIFPCPLFELKRDKDKYGLVKMVYDFLPVISKEMYNLDAPYIRINHNELVEVHDNVAIKNIGVITPLVSSPFRSKILSTPIETEITYHQSSWLGSMPDLYVAGMFAVAINELNPRSVPKGRPYVSIPSLSIQFKERVLQNSLGYAILTLYPEQENRAQFEVDFRSLNDAVRLECAYAKDMLAQLPDENQRKVAGVIVDKLLIGTKVTIGKLEDQLNVPRDEVVKILRSLEGTPFQVSIDDNLGEVSNPHTIIPSTTDDLTRYREGKPRSARFLSCACFHSGDKGVDYSFIENDLPQIIVAEGVKKIFAVGDLTEGNKHDQDRRGDLIDRFPLPQDHQRLAALLWDKVLFEVYKTNFEESEKIESSLPEFIFIPGNHDEHSKNEPPLEVFHECLVKWLTQDIYGYMKRHQPQLQVDYDRIASLVRKRVVFVDNPGIYQFFGLIHEHMGSSEQSTHKGQKSIKPFIAMSGAEVILLGNYHEMNFFLFRIGDSTTTSFNLGTLKRVSGFEGKRSKITEFGVAVASITMQQNNPIRARVKFIPSHLTFRLQDAKEFTERNKDKGRKYHREIEEKQKKT
ncbi:MAG: hypothetical protein HY456_01550 [Parcubacteria group bacterium]|nr:hypothetical protein [Parcubacteria group bacterium]